MIGPRKVDKPLVLYGYGRLGHLAEEIFNELKIPVLIYDKTLPNPVAQFPEDFLLAVCIATEPFMPLKQSLEKQGWTDIVPVWDIIEAYPEVGIHNGWFSENNEVDSEIFVLRGFADIMSRRHYNSYCTWREARAELQVPIIERSPSLPCTLADIRARQKIGLMHDGTWKDVIDIHCEGYEYDTLVLNMDLLQKHRPKISCACYHSRDGLWKIEKFLMDSLPDYRWTFRLTAYMGQGAYIYGVPEERV